MTGDLATMPPFVLCKRQKSVLKTVTPQDGTTLVPDSTSAMSVSTISIGGEGREEGGTPREGGREGERER